MYEGGSKTYVSWPAHDTYPWNEPSIGQWVQAFSAMQESQITEKPLSAWRVYKYPSSHTLENWVLVISHMQVDFQHTINIPSKQIKT